jgi:enediyne biosynthesis protein E4
VNGDGFIDYVAGNFGLNTKYQANADRPVFIHYGDFENNGRCEIVESKFEGDRLYPVRGRSCSSRAMPSLRTKFPTFHDWGSALLPEIYAPEKLAQAVQLSVTQLASGVFLNDGRGRFTFKPLPRLAQTAPIFGLAAVDFTGDGHVDLVAAQNFYGPQVETGRYNGGLSLLLVGDGQGGFTPVAPAESGIAISGEARGVAVADWNRDGWPDFVMTRINQPAMAFSQPEPSTGRSFAVKLTGTPGNVDAIGARITAHYRGARMQTAEISAGSGYLSQHEPVAFFGYADENPPERLEVIWPDGTRSQHAFQPGTPRIELSRYAR